MSGIATKPKVHVHFQMDGLYFVEALRVAATMATLQSAYDADRAEVERLNRRILTAEERHKDDLAASYDETEHDVINLVDGQFTRLDRSAQALAGASATVQILNAACLEAHINQRAAETLRSALYVEFERASLQGKWLLYPRLRGLSGLEAGDQIIQGVAALSAQRNKLSHPKRHRRENEVAFKTPTFLEDLGLRAADAETALASCRAAVNALAIAEGREVPGWLGEGLWQIFHHQWETTPA